MPLFEEKGVALSETPGYCQIEGLIDIAKPKTAFPTEKAQD
jgi:hypothetical protein